MTNLVDAMRDSIDQINHPALRSLLFYHLNDEQHVKEQSQLFSKYYTSTRLVPYLNRIRYYEDNELDYSSALIMVFVYAPDEVCEQVTEVLVCLEEQEFIDLVLNRSYSYTKLLESYVLFTLFHQAPIAVRAPILAKIKTLSKPSLMDILFGKNRDGFFNIAFADFIELISHTDKSSLLSIINLLFQLDLQCLYKYMQTTYAPLASFAGFIELLDRLADIYPEKDDIALLLLSLLSKFEGEQLVRLISGKDIFNLLHVIFASYSQNVVQQLFPILKTITSNKLIHLLTMQTNYAQNKRSALQLAFTRTDDFGVALIIAKEMCNNPKLKPLLTQVSFWQTHSLMHQAAKANNLPLIHWFIEHTDYTTEQINHTYYASSKTMLTIAQNRNHNELINLLIAAPIYRAIQTNRVSEADLTLINDILTAHPAAVKSRWLNQKTLLQHAAAKNLSAIVKLLLNQGALLTDKDDDGNTAIAIAIKTNHHQTLLALMDQVVILKEADVTALVNCLNEVAIPCHGHSLLKSLLSKANAGSLKNTLEKYWRHKNDAFALYLNQLCQLNKTANHLMFSATISQFIGNGLTKLANTTNQLTEDSLKIYLVILLFSLPYQDCVAILSALSLDITQKTQLGLVFSYAMIQPAIFTELTLTQHQGYYQLIKQCCPNREEILPTIAHIHFARSKLTLLPPDILIELATELDYDCMYAINQARNHIIITLFTLQKLFTLPATTSPYKNKSLLLKQLKQQLSYFNHPAMVNDKNSVALTQNLQLLLNITQHQELKKILRSMINKFGFDSQLVQRMRQLFTDYKHELALTEDSCLRELFVEYCCNDQVIYTSRNYTFLTEFLAAATHQEAVTIIHYLLQAKQPLLLIHSLLAPILTGTSDKPSDLALSCLLYRLDTCQAINFSNEKLAECLNLYPLKNHQKNLFNLLNTPYEIKFNEQQIILNQTYAQTVIQQIKRYIERLQQVVVHGLLTNSDERSFELFIGWMLSCGHFSPDRITFDSLVKTINTSNLALTTQAVKQCNQILGLYHHITPWLFDLKILLSKADLSFQEILAFMINTEEFLLNQLIQFAEYAHRYDLQRLAEYARGVKQKAFDSNSLNNHDFASYHLINWLQTIVSSIQHYAEYILSLSVLINGIYLADKISFVIRLMHVSTLINSYGIRPRLDALILFIASYCPILNDPKSMHEAHKFICFLNTLFNDVKLQISQDIVNAIPPTVLAQIINQCLTGLNSDVLDYDRACRSLLTHFCHTTNSSTLQLLKMRLGQQELEILGTEQLMAIAHDILAADNTNLANSTYNGVWIQRLLTAPRFIAACSATALSSLIERYRFISLTLKQAEFEQLNTWLKGSSPFYKACQQSIIHVEQELNQHSEHNALLLAKRNRLLEFRADDSIRALLNQLEDTCLNASEHEKNTAEAALHTLYTHYNNTLTSLRSDLLFNVANFVYSRATRTKGDLAIAQNTLLSWLKKILPHKNFAQMELTVKHDHSIYDREGNHLGFITEANYAVAFVKNELRSLLDINIAPETLLYNKNCVAIGILTASGNVKPINLFQQHTSALLVAKLPITELSHSPAALELLIADIFTENNIATVFKHSKPEKFSWLEQQIANYLHEVNKAVAKINFIHLVHYSSAASIIDLLATIKLQSNAFQLFEALLDNEDKRCALFTPEGTHTTTTLLMQHDAVSLLAHFLIKYHMQPWFDQAFALFAVYAIKKGKGDVLTQALANLQLQAHQHKTLSLAIYDKILITLVSSETNAELILTQFMPITPTQTIQQANSAIVNELTSFFYKPHCIDAIKALNLRHNWNNCKQYRLLMLIFAYQHEQIFYQNELRYSTTQAWSTEELKQMSSLVKHHLQQLLIDENYTVGKRLLGELAFRCANYGMTELFYTKEGQLDVKIASQLLQRSYLNAIAATYYLPVQLEQKTTALMAMVKRWFNEAAQPSATLANLLRENQALLDWKELADQTWAIHGAITEMPLISAYLTNYTGPKEPLIKLIRDYCATNQFIANRCYLYHLSQMMAKLSHRAVSKCIFTVLEEKITANPALLDKTLFTHMAIFYAAQQQHTTDADQKHEQQLQLIRYFGRQKKYNLVCASCKLARLPTPLLAQIQQEAQTEESLSHYQNNWYFALLKFVKRLWHYGRYGINQGSGMVSFCDQADNLSPITPPPMIHTTVLGGQTIEMQLAQAKKCSDLKQRYNVFAAKQQMATQARKITTPHLATRLPTEFTAAKAGQREEARNSEVKSATPQDLSIFSTQPCALTLRSKKKPATTILPQKELFAISKNDAEQERITL